ncbi:blast:Zinc finger protein 879 [Drosophila guanche]|uniref:Blast:Zinc finger protein 879 n=2 Tax=Drosophila guanche TaxID=7266 RepID=A0A3B0JXL7_DROGU|nr:blast:Zinc finger protein 879 [Drosophila guanche]
MPMYQCIYCGAAFPNQSKLTRHLLSHSLKTLEYREPNMLHSHLLSDLNMPGLPPSFAFQMNAAMAASAGGSSDPQEQVAALTAAFGIDMEAALSLAGCTFPSLTGSCLDAPGGSGSSGRLTLAQVAGAASSSSGNGGGPAGLLLSNSGGSGGGAGGAGGAGSGGGGGSSSPSTSAAASAAAQSAGSSAASLLGASSDPNSVVMCDRPFKCEFCGKAFKLRHHMKDHCRVHTGERPFRCNMCGKTFSRSTILKAHEKTHYPKYVRKFLSPSPVDTKDELPQ